MTSSVAERVIGVVADKLGYDRERITPDTEFIKDLGADSLDVAELVMGLEEEFSISIPEEEADKIQTVGQAIDYIAKATAASS